MIARRFPQPATVLVGCLCLHLLVCAEEIITRSGRVLKDASIVAIEGDQVTIRHLGGTEKFNAGEIPEPVQKRFREEALAHQADEVQKLKEELARREQELKRLQSENDRLRLDAEKKRADEAGATARRDAEVKRLSQENARVEREKSAAVPTAAVPAEATPSKPLVSVPELKADDVIKATDLALYYRDGAVAADSRFRKKTFRVAGVVSRFERTPFARRYQVHLETGDRSSSVICKFTYVEPWTAVFTKDSGRLLVAREGSAERLLLRIGDEVTIRGQCEGLKHPDVEFSRCETAQ